MEPSQFSSVVLNEMAANFAEVLSQHLCKDVFVGQEGDDPAMLKKAKTSFFKQPEFSNYFPHANGMETFLATNFTRVLSFFLKEKYENMVNDLLKEVKEAWKKSLVEVTELPSTGKDMDLRNMDLKEFMRINNPIFNPKMLKDPVTFDRHLTEVRFPNPSEKHEQLVQQIGRVGRSTSIIPEFTEEPTQEQRANLLTNDILKAIDDKLNTFRATLNVPIPAGSGKTRIPIPAGYGKTRSLIAIPEIPETERCQSYLTCGKKWQTLTHLNPSPKLKTKYGKLSRYNSLKYGEFKKYFGNSREVTAYTVQVYFKRCTNKFSKLLKENYCKIDVDRAIYSDELKAKLDSLKCGRELFPCPKCFHIGVQDALVSLKVKVLGHDLERSKLCIFFGFSYAMECGISKLYDKKPRTRRLRKKSLKDGEYYWKDDDRNLCDGVYSMCAECEKRQRSTHYTLACHQNAFLSFSHLQTSYGQKHHARDALQILCEILSKRSSNKFTVGENCTGSYLLEDNNNRLMVRLDYNSKLTRTTAIANKVASAMVSLSNETTPPTKKRKQSHAENLPHFTNQGFSSSSSSSSSAVPETDSVPLQPQL